MHSLGCNPGSTFPELPRTDLWKCTTPYSSVLDVDTFYQLVFVSDKYSSLEIRTENIFSAGMIHNLWEQATFGVNLTRLRWDWCQLWTIHTICAACSHSVRIKKAGQSTSIFLESFQLFMQHVQCAWSHSVSMDHISFLGTQKPVNPLLYFLNYTLLSFNDTTLCNDR